MSSFPYDAGTSMACCSVTRMVACHRRGGCKGSEHLASCRAHSCLLEKAPKEKTIAHATAEDKVPTRAKSSSKFIREDYSPWTALDVVRVSTRAMIRYL